MNTWTPAALTNKQPASAGGKGTLPAQRTGFNTLDNWGHKTPTQSKRKRTGKKRLKGHGPKHVYNTLGYTKKKEKQAEENKTSMVKKIQDGQH